MRFATSAGANLGYHGPNFVREGHANLGMQISSASIHRLSNSARHSTMRPRRYSSTAWVPRSRIGRRMLLRGFPSNASTCSFGASSPNLAGSPDSSLFARFSSSRLRRLLMPSGTCAHVHVPPSCHRSGSGSVSRVGKRILRSHGMFSGLDGTKGTQL